MLNIFYIPPVPAAPQITLYEAVSSTSIRFEWTSVMGAVNYTIIVEEFIKSPAQSFTKTFTDSGGQIDDLNNFTTYSCKVYASNSAGRSAPSNTKIITTCKCIQTAGFDGFSDDARTHKIYIITSKSLINACIFCWKWCSHPLM